MSKIICVLNFKDRYWVSLNLWVTWKWVTPCGREKWVPLEGETDYPVEVESDHVYPAEIMVVYRFAFWLGISFHGCTYTGLTKSYIYFSHFTLRAAVQWYSKLNFTSLREWTWRHNTSLLAYLRARVSTASFCGTLLFSLKLTTVCAFLSCLTGNTQWHHVHSQSGIKFIYFLMTDWVYKLFVSIQNLSTTPTW